MHLQLGKEVAEHKNVRPELLQMIRKATAKKPLRLPPAQLELNEIEQTIREGKQQRFQSCEEFIHALETILSVLQTPAKSKGFFEKLFG